MSDSKELYSKIAGCLLGGALGDALGYEIEFDTWKEIVRRFGEEGIRDLKLDGGAARFSDDTQMTLFTLEGMIHGFWRSENRGVGGPAEYYIYEDYLVWLKTQRFTLPKESLWEPVSELLKIPEMNHRRAPGNTCLNALASGEMGTIEKPINNSKGCGGVMRTAPVGFLPCYGDPILNGAKAAAITHGHPMGYIPAGMLSGIIAKILFEEKKPLKTVIEESLRETEERFPDEPTMPAFSEMIRKAVTLSGQTENDVETIHSIGGGWVGDEALAVAIYCVLKYENDLKETLIVASNHSGDSDSTAAIAGNILGCYLGDGAIDPEWIEKLEMQEYIKKMARDTIGVIDRCGGPDRCRRLYLMTKNK